MRHGYQELELKGDVVLLDNVQLVPKIPTENTGTIKIQHTGDPKYNQTAIKDIASSTYTATAPYKDRQAALKRLSQLEKVANWLSTETPSR